MAPWTSNGERPTIADVAAAAGVSRSTASRAMGGSGYVSPATRDGCGRRPSGSRSSPTSSPARSASARRPRSASCCPTWRAPSTRRRSRPPRRCSRRPATTCWSSTRSGPRRASGRSCRRCARSASWGSWSRATAATRTSASRRCSSTTWSPPTGLGGVALDNVEGVRSSSSTSRSRTGTSASPTSGRRRRRGGPRPAGLRRPRAPRGLPHRGGRRRAAAAGALRPHDRRAGLPRGRARGGARPAGARPAPDGHRGRQRHDRDRRPRDDARARPARAGRRGARVLRRAVVRAPDRSPDHVARPSRRGARARAAEMLLRRPPGATAPTRPGQRPGRARAARAARAPLLRVPRRGRRDRFVTSGRIGARAGAAPHDTSADAGTSGAAVGTFAVAWAIAGPSGPPPPAACSSAPAAGSSRRTCRPRPWSPDVKPKETRLRERRRARRLQVWNVSAAATPTAAG